MDIEIFKAGMYSLILESPVIAVYLAGIVISFYKKRELGQDSVLTIIAFSMALVLSVVRVLFNSYMPILMHSGDYDMQTTVTVIGGINLMFSILMAAVWGLVAYIILFRSKLKILK